MLREMALHWLGVLSGVVHDDEYVLLPLGRFGEWLFEVHTDPSEVTLMIGRGIEMPVGASWGQYADTKGTIDKTSPSPAR